MTETTSLNSEAPRTQDRRIVIALGAGRTAVGVLLLASPRLLPGLMDVPRRASSPMEWAMRMVGGREIGLGLGSVVASRTQSASAVRGWVAAGMVSDATDSIAIAVAMAAGSLARRPATIVAASAAALAATEALLLARRPVVVIAAS